MTAPDVSGSPRDRSERWGFARLTKRAEFQRVAKGRRGHARCVSLQGAARPEATDAGAPVIEAPRIGLTITRKVGGAVERNRIRRRLRAALKLAAGLDQRPGHDYVVVARHEALTADFAALRADLARAFQALHEPRDRDGRRPGKPRGKTAAPAAHP